MEILEQNTSAQRRNRPGEPVSDPAPGGGMRGKLPRLGLGRRGAGSPDLTNAQTGMKKEE